MDPKSSPFHMMGKHSNTETFQGRFLTVFANILEITINKAMKIVCQSVLYLYTGLAYVQEKRCNASSVNNA